MHRNVCKYKHTSEHAYAENLEVEYYFSDTTHKNPVFAFIIKKQLNL